jgi:O-acetylhomoserine/O-acetylserine sulfhydrylase-like pyridoxal-dependent enzyme
MSRKPRGNTRNCSEAILAGVECCGLREQRRSENEVAAIAATIPQKEKIHQVRTTEADFEAIKQLQDFWKLPNQQSVVSKLIGALVARVGRSGFVRL